MSNYYAAAQQALHQWAQWRRLPQFYANLRGHSNFDLMPIPHSSPPMREIRLDPFARRIDEAVQRLPEIEAGIVWAYYIRGVTYEANPEPFRAYGMAKRQFYERLEEATIRAYNAARSNR